MQDVFPEIGIKLGNLDVLTCDLFDQEFQHVATSNVAQDVVVLLTQVIAIVGQHTETNS